MDENFICSNSEACLEFIHYKFDCYKRILDDDQQACDNAIAFIRQQACLYNGSDDDDDDEKLRSITGFDRIQLANQLDYFEQEAFKTNEENKTCLFKMFQNLLNLHNRGDFERVRISEHQIAESFQYRPSVLANIEKLRLPMNSITSSSRIHSEKNHASFTATPTPNISLATPVHSTSFSNRAEIQAFQQKKNPVSPKILPAIESNEIDLTKLIRETNQNKIRSGDFQFSKMSQHLRQQQKKTTMTSPKKSSHQSISCDDALLVGANKRYVLLYNMNISSILYLFDTQTNETKEILWDEGDILSVGHVESNIFYIITSTKIFLYDIIKEDITSQYFLYDTLYKDLLLITANSFYQTLLKRNNQIQSTVYDDYCYYLYTNKDYSQIFIKCLIDNFFQETNINLTKLHPDIRYFLSFTVTKKSLITFLISDSSSYQLLVCDETQNFNILKIIPMNNSIEPTKMITTFASKMINYSPTKNKNKGIKYGKQVWFILDTKRNCIDCFTHEEYLTTIEPRGNDQIQSISLFDDKLILAYNQLSIEIIDIDKYFSSFEV
ncbi:unnamed protein product [Rotaria magnacalcarata]|uniref:Uncharacterized protein n=3 Tax=Rotaria magnacalcarata TaxID=392030 RepID=A0A816KJE9_9BILA|nr:unnamed protein product [Rotaria magnacalcarata]CAF1235564.1 unnamed protein product [Rotaria magnacalcarata]CAF1910446.1 unnamed protein product [Rotaria magnacalcarata]